MKISSGVRTVSFAVASIIAASSAFAAPHFLSASASKSGTTLTVSFREAGLGNADVNISASATVEQQQACINGGDKNPAAANKSSFTSTANASGTFTPKNGSVSGSLTLSAPSTGFSCPGGQRLVTLSVTYTNVRITDTTNGVSASVSGTF